MTTAKLPTAQSALADFFGEVANFPEGVLSGSHTAAVTTITLTATIDTDWPTAGAVTIDSEIIHYTGKSGATLTGATRGAQGTTAATHADAAKVIPALTAATVNQLIVELIQMSKTGAGAKGADVASAGALNIGEDGRYFHVTGTTGITSIEARLAGQEITLEFDGAVLLTHNATSLILQGAANYTTAAGDVLKFVSEGSGNWRESSRRLAAASAGGWDKCCRVYNDATQAIADSTDVVITFNQENYDTDTMHSTASNTGRITFTTAGVYGVIGNLRFEGNATGFRQLRIRLNGTTVIAETRVPVAGAVVADILEVETHYKFAATDYVELIANQSSGIPLNSETTASYLPSFMAAKVGTG